MFKEWEECCGGLCEGDLLRVLEEQIPESVQQSFSKLERETENGGMQPEAFVRMLKTTTSLLPRAFIRVSSWQEFMLNHVPVLLERLGGNVHGV